MKEPLSWSIDLLQLGRSNHFLFCSSCENKTRTVKKSCRSQCGIRSTVSCVQFSCVYLLAVCACTLCISSVQCPQFNSPPSLLHNELSCLAKKRPKHAQPNRVTKVNQNKQED
ncbi:hypothetical protein DL98DRAFT_11634 [Cadophora sp. DSE1049]|nr:hypothetical protein DL98DRAFT_11634 [Cadophora sp. DSE1049]